MVNLFQLFVYPSYMYMCNMHGMSFGGGDGEVPFYAKLTWSAKSEARNALAPVAPPCIENDGCCMMSMPRSGR